MKTAGLFIVAAMFLTGFLAACGGGKLEDSSAKTELPEGHPSVDDAGSQPAMTALGSDEPTDGEQIPLKLKGLNSLDELTRGLEGTDNAEARELFATGFRKTFSADASKRDYVEAARDLESALELDPNFAEAHRALGYARFNTGFDMVAALDEYQKAVELKPDYGEAHYALAFLYAMGDLEKGSTHFKKAMELGIEDERDLGGKFYTQ